MKNSPGADKKPAPPFSLRINFRQQISPPPKKKVKVLRQSLLVSRKRRRGNAALPIKCLNVIVICH